MADDAKKPVNASLSMSEAGIEMLRGHESVRRTAYNDPVNCTIGVGELVHYGKCTSEDKALRLTDEQVNEQLKKSVAEAEKAVRRKVKDQSLTQEQFDAAVSFTFNAGPAGAKHVLNEINKGEMAKACERMKRYVKVSDRDADGKKKRDEKGKVIMITLPGLVLRRDDECKPFQPAAAPPSS